MALVVNEYGVSCPWECRSSQQRYRVVCEKLEAGIDDRQFAYWELSSCASNDPAQGHESKSLTFSPLLLLEYAGQERVDVFHRKKTKMQQRNKGFGCSSRKAKSKVLRKRLSLESPS